MRDWEEGRYKYLTINTDTYRMNEEEREEKEEDRLGRKEEEKEEDRLGRKRRENRREDIIIVYV